jgi:hypothetical protein
MLYVSCTEKTLQVQELLLSWLYSGFSFSIPFPGLQEVMFMVAAFERDNN